jgi:homoserine kinase
MKVRVEVPATVANLGPGFDSVGLAVAMTTIVEVEIAGDEIVVENTGPWASALSDAPMDANNLMARAFLEAAGSRAPKGVRFTQDLQAPVGRGFGSSAAAIVAGIVAADACGLTDPDADLLDLAVSLEGHPDNVSPCLLGGITASAGETTIRISPPTDWTAILAIAPAVRADGQTVRPSSTARVRSGDGRSGRPVRGHRRSVAPADTVRGPAGKRGDRLLLARGGGSRLPIGGRPQRGGDRFEGGCRGSRRALLRTRP